MRNSLYNSKEKKIDLTFHRAFGRHISENGMHTSPALPIAQAPPNLLLLSAANKIEAIVMDRLDLQCNVRV